ncbi:hypothetical protein O1425_21945, partial [Bacteroides fragilis]|nr:hypothetical protein [Bacteroides fragilis]
DRRIVVLPVELFQHGQRLLVLPVLDQADRVHVGTIDDRHHNRILDHIPAVEVEIEFHTAQQRIIPFPDA